MLLYLFCNKSHYENVPFEIPESWAWVTLSEVCEVARGGSPRPIKDYLTTNEDGVNWIKIGDTDKDGKYINSTKEKIIPEGVHRSRFVHKGDFLLTNSMSFGRPYILNIDGCIHDGWLVISPFANTYVTEFLYFLLSSSFAYDQFADAASGGVVSNLNSDKVANSYFPLPPEREQRRIINELNNWFKVVGELDKNIQGVKSFVSRIKSKILDLAISGKLVPQDPNDEPAIKLLKRINPGFEPCDNSHYENLPQGWVKAGFKDIYQTISSRDYQIQQRDIINEGLYPVVSQSSNYIEGYYNNKEKLLDVTAPMLIFGDHTRVVKYIDFPFVIGADGVKVIKPLVNDKFAYYLLLYTSQHIENKGYSRHFQLIAKANYCIPPLREQTHIVKTIETLFETINTITAEL